MSFEEPEDKYERLFQQTKQLQIFRKFRFDFESEVYQVVKVYRPFLHENIHAYVIKVKDILERASGAASDILFSCIGGNGDSVLLGVPKIISREEEELKLSSEMLDIPDKWKNEYSQMFWETYEEEVKSQEYIFAVFNKMKEIMVDYYLNDIINLEGNLLRKLNGSLYHLAAWEMIDELYMLEDEIRAKKENTDNAVL